MQNLSSDFVSSRIIRKSGQTYVYYIIPQTLWQIITFPETTANRCLERADCGNGFSNTH